MDFDEWARYGVEQGWCGPLVCAIHDGVPTSAGEDEAFDDGDDPCISVIRLYANEYEKTGVESNHSPSQWRKHYIGAKP
jgi:hypothetical protein